MSARDGDTGPAAATPRTRLRLAPSPAAGRPDTRVSVALALLGPIDSVLDDAAANALCTDGTDTTAADELATDPRYVIGRLHQALTALLAADVPPMDATARLLGEAIDDAIAYRERTCPACTPQRKCPGCWQHWRKAGQYRALCADLGIIDENPPQPPALTLVPGNAADQA